MLVNSISVEGGGQHLRNDQVSCLDDLFCKKSLLAEWNTKSPSIAAIRLYCGVMALKKLVSKGEPCVMSSGYNLSNFSISDSDAFGRKYVVR